MKIPTTTYLLRCAVLATAFTASAAIAQAPGASAIDKADTQIVIGMAQANMAEIEAGKLAIANAKSAEVKAFAQQMIDDHGKALEDVKAVAQKKGVTLPAEPDAKHKQMAAQLSKLSGDAFDKKYMAEAGVKDHTKVLAKLKADEKKAKDPDVKALAVKMQPTVQQHLEHANKAHSASGTAK